MGAGPPVALVSPAAFSCSPQSPPLVLGQALEGGFPFWTLELCPGGGTQPPGQPLRFLARNWMPWSLGSAAPGARAIVACVGTGWHAAASWWGLCRASLPTSCSCGFWFLRQLGFQDLGKSGLGGCGWLWRDKLGGPLTAEVGFSKQERRAARGSRQSLG